MMEKLQYKIKATFVLWPHLSPFSGLTSQSKQQENCIHLDMLSSPLVNAFSCQKCSGLVGNWGYISRRLLRSFFWWPQLCCGACKRSEQLTVIACFMSPVWYHCLRSLVSPMGRPLWGDTRDLSDFDLFSIDFRGNGNFFPTSAPSGLCLNTGRYLISEYLCLFNSQECKD